MTSLNILHQPHPLKKPKPAVSCTMNFNTTIGTMVLYKGVGYLLFSLGTLLMGKVSSSSVAIGKSKQASSTDVRVLLLADIHVYLFTR